jgi:hypothetical protein
MSIINDTAHENRKDRIAEIMKDEVIHSIHSLKIYKTPGIDNIPAELLKYGGPELEKVMTDFCQKIYSTILWSEE